MRLSFKKTNMKKLLLISSLVAVLAGCSTNAITGRKQLSLFPESTLQAQALTQYKAFLGENKVVNPADNNALMVKRVGAKIALNIMQNRGRPMF